MVRLTQPSCKLDQTHEESPNPASKATVEDIDRRVAAGNRDLLAKINRNFGAYQQLRKQLRVSVNDQLASEAQLAPHGPETVAFDDRRQARRTIMAWSIPEFKLDKVNAAARQLSEQPFPLVGDSALSIINNWRSSHSYPLNTFQITLRNKARKCEREVVVAQRIKRLESIHAKLARQKNMRMTQMQDIAGCRAVLKSMKNVTRLVDAYKNSHFDHKPRGEKDYINNPKKDGYRCHHLIFEYVVTDATKAYSGLKVEIQIRTQLQHA